MIGRGRRVPSSSPRRFAMDPAAKLRTMTSSGMISHWRINCSRMFRRLMKWFGIPSAVSPVMKNSDRRLFNTPLAFDGGLLFGVEGGRIILEILDQRSRLGAFVKGLRLTFVDFLAARHEGLQKLMGRESLHRPLRAAL